MTALAPTPTAERARRRRAAQRLAGRREILVALDVDVIDLLDDAAAAQGQTRQSVIEAALNKAAGEVLS